jgi:hypothetical protein
MPLTSRAEFYFIIAMMFLILVVCVVACVVFYKTYKKEMREREKNKAVKENQNAGTTK